MPARHCPECQTVLGASWHFCSHCGQEVPPVEINSTPPERNRKAVALTVLTISSILLASLYGVVSDNSKDLLAQLKNRGVLAWVEDTHSEIYLNSGEYQPEELISTPTGSCLIFMYATESEANRALQDYIALNAEFASAWAGVNPSNKQGAVLITREDNSYCSKEAASIMDWTLD